MGQALAVGGQLNLLYLHLFLLGAVVMRSAGCVINDLADKNLDAQVERTKQRPLASGELKPKQAIIFLGLLLCIALAIALILPPIALYIGALSLPLIILYPFAKRFTYFPQVLLGVCFNLGALIGYAVQQPIDASAILLYVGCVLWTIGYDTIYAHQDKTDDVKAGIKSTALKFGDNTKLLVAVLYSLFIALIITALDLKNVAPISYIILFFVSLILARQVLAVNLNKPASCMLAFKNNVLVGIVIFVALLLS